MYDTSFCVTFIIDAKNIRIYHECESGIEKPVPRITVWHHKACLKMSTGDREGRIFQSHPNTYNGFFLLLTINYLIFILKMIPEVPEYAEM